MNKKNIKNNVDYLSILSNQEIVVILKQLFDEKEKIKEEFDLKAKQLLNQISPDDIEDEIYSELELIELETVYKSTGSRYGNNYQYPDEIIYEMVEEILDSYLRKIDSLINQMFYQEALLICKAILKVLYDFEMKSSSEIFNELPEGMATIAEELILDKYDALAEIVIEEDSEDFFKNFLPKWKLS